MCELERVAAGAAWGLFGQKRPVRRRGRFFAVTVAMWAVRALCEQLCGLAGRTEFIAEDAEIAEGGWVCLCELGRVAAGAAWGLFGKKRPLRSRGRFFAIADAMWAVRGRVL